MQHVTRHWRRKIIQQPCLKCIFKGRVQHILLLSFLSCQQIVIMLVQYLSETVQYITSRNTTTCQWADFVSSRHSQANPKSPWLNFVLTAWLPWQIAPTLSSAFELWQAWSQTPPELLMEGPQSSGRGYPRQVELKATGLPTLQDESPLIKGLLLKYIQYDMDWIFMTLQLWLIRFQPFLWLFFKLLLCLLSSSFLCLVSWRQLWRLPWWTTNIFYCVLSAVWLLLTSCYLCISVANASSLRS